MVTKARFKLRSLEQQATHWSLITYFWRLSPLVFGIKNPIGDPEDRSHTGTVSLKSLGMKAMCLANSGSYILSCMILDWKAKKENNHS